eukprot:530274_1
MFVRQHGRSVGHIAQWNEIKSKLDQYGSFQSENEKEKLDSVIHYCQKKKLTPHQLVHTGKADIVSQMLNDSEFKIDEWQNVFDQIELIVKETDDTSDLSATDTYTPNERYNMSISVPINDNQSQNKQSQNNEDILEHVEQKHIEENTNRTVTSPIITVPENDNFKD